MSRKKPDEGAQASVTNKHFASVDYRNISQDLCAAIFQSRISKIFPLARRAAFCVLFAGRETIFAAAATQRDSHLIISGRIYFRRRGSHPLNGSGFEGGKVRERGFPPASLSLSHSECFIAMAMTPRLFFHLKRAVIC
jgi:hypothetical protein